MTFRAATEASCHRPERGRSAKLHPSLVRVCATLLLPVVLAAPAPAAAGVLCVKYDYSPNVVRAMQRTLAAKGAEGLAVDGKFGPRTRAALVAFQKTNSVPASGELDAATFRALFGADVPFEGVTVTRNPDNAPEDIYRKFCP